MISLVTACMNREEHLRRSLPAWLGLPGIGEIVIVDWSNARPLGELTRLDPRVRVVRAEGETRWILSYAYNLGIAHSRGGVILKCDADCLPRPEVTAVLPDQAGFLAGFWRSGAALGRPSVNGQCFITRAQFEAVNGYSELIRTYGRDDEDFYDRLIAAGYLRREIPAASLEFLDHPHEARMANQIEQAGAGGIEAWLHGNVVYHEMRNLGLARALPWGPERPRAAFRTLATEARVTVVQRNAAAELPIPAAVAYLARLRALRYLVQEFLKLPAAAAARLDEGTCLALLGRRLRGNVPPSPAAAAFIS